MAVSSVTGYNRPVWVGLSTDTKPTYAVVGGSIFFEADTQHRFVFEVDGNWYPYTESVALNDGAGNPISSSGGVLFTAAYLWQPSTLSYIHASADASGNLNVTGGGGGGGGTVNIRDTAGNSLNSTSGALNVAIAPSGSANAPTSGSVSSSDSVVLAANAARKKMVIVNIGSTNVFFGDGQAAVMNSGIVLTPNGTWVMDSYTFTTAAIHAICATSSALSIQEYQ